MNLSDLADDECELDVKDIPRIPAEYMARIRLGDPGLALITPMDARVFNHKSPTDAWLIEQCGEGFPLPVRHVATISSMTHNSSQVRMPIMPCATLDAAQTSWAKLQLMSGV